MADITLDGVTFTEKQVREAFACCRTLARAWAESDEENGGGGEMEWDDVGLSVDFAQSALGPEAVRLLNSEAKRRNGEG